MARILTSADELREFAKTFQELANALEDCAKVVDQTDEMPGVFIHSQTIRKKHMPDLWGWVATIEKDVKTQSRALKAGIKSQAERDIERSSKAKESTKPKKKGAK